MTTGSGRLAGDLLAALREHPGIRPSVPETQSSWLPWDLDTLAVDVTAETVTVRVVALALPLPGLLDRAGTALRAVLDASPWSGAALHLVVTDIDATALRG